MKIDKQRIVVKVGTSLLTEASGGLKEGFIHSLVKELCYLLQSNSEVVLVTSGAIGLGMKRLGLKVRPKAIPLEQACAAIGQNLLMETYERLFSQYNQTIAQVLLTRRELSNRQCYLNIQQALSALFAYKVIPIINENDTVAVDEIKVGDNDTLSALVANLIQADWLIILSNIQGLYDQENALVSTVKEVTPDILRLAKGTKSQVCVGGMRTKLEAAKMVINSGTTTVIANGEEKEVLRRIVSGEKLGTIFIARKSRLSHRKRWIYNLKTGGEIEVDDGAKKAILKDGKSLLPSGILKTRGNFIGGSAILIVDSSNQGLAKGLTNYSKKEIEQIKGKNSAQIEEMLGYKYADEVVHRDNLVVLNETLSQG